MAEWVRLEKASEPLIQLGAATCGLAAGAEKVFEIFQEELKARGLSARLTRVGCMGHCYAEPMAVITREGFPPTLFGNLTEGIVRVLVRQFLALGDLPYEFVLGALEESELVPSVWDFPRFAKEERRLLDICGIIDPENINHYIAKGGYAGLARALAGLSPEDVIKQVEASGLRGLGGAGFSTGRKWRLCRAVADDPKYIICNADEGDPGAFMDRTLLESNPQAILEGMITAGYAVGSTQGLIYVRAEYPLAVSRLIRAIEEATEKDLLGQDILKSGFTFGIEVVQGAGAFVCGESSALMYSVEGRRGMPRVRPPRSVDYGLHGKPTVLNNVKSLASIPLILSMGADKFSQVGTDGSKGTAIFALAGKVLNTGLVEVPMGTSMKDLIFHIGGGVPGGRKFKAVQIGGPSGGCMPEQLLDTSIDFDALQKVGAMMGSGGLVVLDEDNCMVDTARYFLEFTQRESCGKCTFCRLGTKHMLMILEKLTQGEATFEDLEILEELAGDIEQGSLCNLGATAPGPILTVLRYFRDEVEAHIRDKCCPARVCKALTVYYILPDKCARGCDACVGSCPMECISTEPKHRIKVIDQEKCVKCNACLEACPEEYDAVTKISPVSLLPQETNR